MATTPGTGGFFSSKAAALSNISSTLTRPGTSGGSSGGDSKPSRPPPTSSAPSIASRPPSVLRKASFTKSHKARTPSINVDRPAVAVAIPKGTPRLFESRSPDASLPSPPSAMNNMIPLPTTRPTTSHTINGGPSQSNRPTSPTVESITYQHIQEMASKRISTLDYLRKAHEGRIYWFNTLLFNKADLNKMPYFDARKLGRRATNYLLLGLSLPVVLDMNGSTPSEFLRSLNALLAEFESFQQIHPPDGSSSSLSRARIPQMFKRATGVATAKGRRTSSAAEIGMPTTYEASDTSGSIASGSTAAISLPTGDTDLLPGEEYLYLATPALPFDPDFYETFATLCDVLIDCYTRLMSLISTPQQCNPAIAEMFTKADARIRKIIIQGVVKEFEDGTRSGVKSEVAGVGKVVLGGLV